MCGILITHTLYSIQSAQMAQLSSTELFQCLYFSSLKPGEARDRVEGVIVGLRSNGITVMVPRCVCVSLILSVEQIIYVI